MVEPNDQNMTDVRASKKRHLPNELAHRFSSKKDFLTYFSNQLQLYVPPKIMVNKGKYSCLNLRHAVDFLR
jgi:hypothetical protein